MGFSQHFQAHPNDVLDILDSEHILNRVKFMCKLYAAIAARVRRLGTVLNWCAMKIMNFKYTLVI